MSEQILHLTGLLHGHAALPSSVLDSAYHISRMLHAPAGAASGEAFYRAFVPELGSALFPQQIELVKRCLKNARGEMHRVACTMLPGLVNLRMCDESDWPHGGCRGSGVVKPFGNVVKPKKIDLDPQTVRPDEMATKVMLSFPVESYPDAGMPPDYVGILWHEWRDKLEPQSLASPPPTRAQCSLSKHRSVRYAHVSRMLRRIPFLVEEWYWLLVYWTYLLARAFTAVTEFDERAGGGPVPFLYHPLPAPALCKLVQLLPAGAVADEPEELEHLRGLIGELRPSDTEFDQRAGGGPVPFLYHPLPAPGLCTVVQLLPAGAVADEHEELEHLRGTKCY
ncbi:hypothetical protein B0H14DRAFT_3690839 [Mycena olivaceomarginata]|nr:hypothetical protein B0H14DRAFT_3690839 [Mycena olivaceomarginata]